MAEAGFSVGTFTGGGTFRTESLSGTLTPVGIVAWGGAGTATRVTPTTPLPAQVYGGTLNAGTVTVSNTGTVVGTVAVSNTGTVVGTVATSNAGTVGMLQAGTLDKVASGTITTVAMLQAGTISTIAGGTVVATAAGTQVVSGTVSVSGGTIGLSGGTVAVLQAGTIDKVASGTITTVAMLQAGTITTIAGGTVVATAAGTQVVSGTVSVSGGTVNPSLGQGKTLQYGTISLASGSVSLVGAPGTGTAIYIVGISISAGTVGAFNFAQGVGAAVLTGTISVDQYGGFVDRGQPTSPVLKGAAGSQIYLNVLSGTPNLGGYFSYFVE